MSVLVNDPDLTIYVGDTLDVLRRMPDGSVDCCVTSPPYWGLRDYGTGSWDGVNADCDHTAASGRAERPRGALEGGTATVEASTVFRDVCGKCGARRVDQQLGLEATPDQYVANMVAVFREVRRVLTDHGTLWLNLGDSYNSSSQNNHGKGGPIEHRHLAPDDGWAGHRPLVPGLKPKDLVGIPWRVAFALQADGWYLRSDIIWAKPNPMPESVTDRPTKAHEYVFLLSKRPRYWFDQEAVREPLRETWQAEKSRTARPGIDTNGGGQGNGTMGWNPAGRNVRSVWEIATQPYPDAHFATFPEDLPRRCILAGCPEWVCGTCHEPRVRIVEREQPPEPEHRQPLKRLDPGQAGNVGNGNMGFRASRLSGQEMNRWRAENPGTETWSDCCHDNYRPGVVLDPFLGSGTTALVARNHGRSCVGIELNPVYAALAARRLQQLSLLAVPDDDARIELVASVVWTGREP